jgi:hypothetical protein
MRHSHAPALFASFLFNFQIHCTDLNGGASGNCSGPSSLAPFPELRKLQILDLFPVEDQIPAYQHLLRLCSAEIREKSDELLKQVVEDDVAFFESMHESGKQPAAEEPDPADTDPTDTAARALVRRIRHLHDTGEAYAALAAANGTADEARRRSTALWEQFSRDAVDSLLSHSPRCAAGR